MEAVEDAEGYGKREGQEDSADGDREGCETDFDPEPGLVEGSYGVGVCWLWVRIHWVRRCNS